MVFLPFTFLITSFMNYSCQQLHLKLSLSWNCHLFSSRWISLNCSGFHAIKFKKEKKKRSVFCVHSRQRWVFTDLECYWFVVERNVWGSCGAPSWCLISLNILKFSTFYSKQIKNIFLRLLWLEHQSCLDLLAVYHLKHSVSAKEMNFFFFLKI